MCVCMRMCALVIACVGRERGRERKRRDIALISP